MKTVMSIIGGLFVLMGLLWIGQGLKIIPGTFMSGSMVWGIFGAIELVLGLGLLFLMRRVR